MQKCPRLQASSSAIRRTFLQYFTRFQLTALHDQLSPKWSWPGSRGILNFGQIGVNIWKTVQDRDILSMEDYSKWYLAYRMAPLLVTLNDLEGHFSVAGLFTCNPSKILQYFTRFQPTARSRGPSATAGLLVRIGTRLAKLQAKWFHCFTCPV